MIVLLSISAYPLVLLLVYRFSVHRVTRLPILEKFSFGIIYVLVTVFVTRVLHLYKQDIDTTLVLVKFVLTVLLSATLTTLAWLDWRERYLPLHLNGVLAMVASVLLLVDWSSGKHALAVGSLVAGTTGSGLLLLFCLFSGGEKLGLGDVILSWPLGVVTAGLAAPHAHVLLRVSMVLEGVALGCVVGLLGFGVAWARRVTQANLSSVPLGTFLIVGSSLMALPAALCGLYLLGQVY